MDIADIRHHIQDFAKRNLLDERAGLHCFVNPPRPLDEMFRGTGLANWWLPKAYGGLAVSLADSVDIVTELAYGDAAAAFTLFAPVLGSTLVSLYGTKELRQRYLPSMAQHGGCCALLHSGHPRVRATFTSQGPELILNGDKHIAANAGAADFLVVIAAPARDPLHQRVIVVPGNAPGVRISKRSTVNGPRFAAIYQVALDNCRVPDDHALSGPGPAALAAGLDPTLILLAATTIGTSRRIRDLSIDYARTRARQPTSQFRDTPEITAQIGWMDLQIEVMRSQCRCAAAELDAVLNGPNAAAELLHRGTSRSALAARIFCDHTGRDIAEVGAHMFADFGYPNEGRVSQLVRDIRHLSAIEAGAAATTNHYYATKHSRHTYR